MGVLPASFRYAASLLLAITRGRPDMGPGEAFQSAAPGPVMRPRVLVADDHPVMLHTLVALLTEECDVVGRASDGTAAIEEARRVRPDVVVLDVSMPAMGGFDAARQIAADLPEVGIVFVTALDDPAVIREAFQIRESACVLKHAADANLLATVQKAFRRR